MPSLSRLFVLAFLLIAPGAAAARAEAPKVVVSIAPLHSLVSGVMAGVGMPYLVIRGAGSPHSYALKPSDARALSGASIVFWIGKDLEQFLERPLKALAGKARTVAMIDTPGLRHLKFREGGLFADHGEEEKGHSEEKGHGDSHKDEHHHHGEVDLHVWLDPKNAEAMVLHIEKTLRKADPENAARYGANAKSMLARLDQLDRELQKTLAPVKGKPFVVFHDSYQYLETRYGVSMIGSITANPDVPPGAAHLKALKAEMKKRGARCAFAEPQFDPGRVKALNTGLDVRTGSLDPLGSGSEPGPELYFALMRALAKNLAACLFGSG